MTAILAALVLLAIAGIAAPVLWPWPRLSKSAAVCALCIAGGACILAALTRLLSGDAADLHASWPLPIGAARLAIDSLSAWFLLIIGCVTLPVGLYAHGYFGDDDQARQPAALSLMCVLVASLIVAVCARDAVLFLVAWESMSLSAFLLVGLRHHDAEARRGAWMYLVATHIGTALGVMPVFGVLVGRSGSTAFADFGPALSTAGTTTITILFLLAVLGFGAKAGLMPMHVWLPAAHPVAPSPVSALMSGVVIKMGIYGLLRTLTWLPAVHVSLPLALLTLGAITAVVGVLYALAQSQYKRLLAYSSVENIGLIAMGIGLGLFGRSTGQDMIAALGFGGAMLHALNHALFKGLLFLSAGAVLHGTNTPNMEALGGLARRDPLNAGLFLVGALAICALPPLNGFVSEFLLYSGFLHGVRGALYTSVVAIVGIAVLALVGGLALSAFARVAAVVFAGEPRDNRVTMHPTGRPMLAGMALLAAGCLFTGLGGPAIAGVAGRAVPASLTGAAASADLYATVGDLLSPVSGIGLLLLALTGGLVVARSRFRGRRVSSPSIGTWGCGFAAPTARMQYSGSSFARTLVTSFGHLVRSDRVATLPAGPFPECGRLQTSSADAAVESLFAPLFRRIRAGCERLWPLQHGRIQLYLLYIVVTLVVVLAWEAISSGLTSGWPPPAPAPG